MPANELTDSDAALAVAGLTKRYGEGRGAGGVADLSFEVPAGTILGLVGKNGAGKTTTLRSIAGVLPFQEGLVRVDGVDLVERPEAAKRRLAWVPDEPRPFDSLTVLEHLEFHAGLYGVPDWRPRAEELLERFELAHKRDALGSELSRGMRQKLAFCGAWLPAPSVVLLDEPLSGLDPRGIRSARDAIRDLARGGTAVVLSSHQLELIEALADRLLILHGGRALFLGTLSEARERLAPRPEGDEGVASSLEEIFLAVTEDGDPE